MKSTTGNLECLHIDAGKDKSGHLFGSLEGLILNNNTGGATKLLCLSESNNSNLAYIDLSKQNNLQIFEMVG